MDRAPKLRDHFKTPDARFQLQCSLQPVAGPVKYRPDQQTRLATVSRSQSKEGQRLFAYTAGDNVVVCSQDPQRSTALKSIPFSVSPTCLADSEDRRAEGAADIVVGTRKGELWLLRLEEHMASYTKSNATQFNKDGVHGGRCLAVAWVPTSGYQHFISAHADGCLYVFDVNKAGGLNTDPTAFVTPTTPTGTPKAESGSNLSSLGSGASAMSRASDPTQLTIKHTKSSKSQAITKWVVSSIEAAITDISFSPDGALLAVTARDGYLRIFDYATQSLRFACKSYYGAVLCCAWSPDSEYVAFGGEDDLVTLFGLRERAVVAWGEGHNSWVSCIAFDGDWTPPEEVAERPGIPRSASQRSLSNSDSNVAEAMRSAMVEAQKVFRVGSVGEDTQLILWEFYLLDPSAEDLADEAAAAMAELSTRDGEKPRDTIARNAAAAALAASKAVERRALPVPEVVPAPKKSDIPRVFPVMAHSLHSEPIAALAFQEGKIVTVDRVGVAKVWAPEVEQ